MTDTKQAFTFNVHMGSNDIVEVCRFSVLNDDTLHIQWNKNMKVTEAARRFIAVVKEQLDNMDKATISKISPAGDN
jgi:hypothetical protein